MDRLALEADFSQLEKQLGAIRADMEHIASLVNAVEQELVRFRDGNAKFAVNAGRAAGQVAHISGKGGAASLATGLVVGAAVMAGGALVESAWGWFKRGEVRERERLMAEKLRQLAREKRAVVAHSLVALRPVAEAFKTATIAAASQPIRVEHAAWSVAARPGLDAAFSGWSRARHTDAGLRKLQEVFERWEAGELVLYDSPTLTATHAAVLTDLRDRGLSPVDTHFALILVGDVVEHPDLTALGITRLGDTARSAWAWRRIGAIVVPFTQRSKQVRAYWNAVLAKEERMQRAYRDRVVLSVIGALATLATGFGGWWWMTSLT